MRTKFIYFLGFLFCFAFLSSCEDKLDIQQQGVTLMDDFYKTDADAQEAVAAVYNSWRSIQYNDFFLKNLLSDDIIAGGGSRGDNSQLEQIGEYQFGPTNTMISGYFSALYAIIYRANLVINHFPADSTATMTHAVADAKVARGWAYFNLVTLWGEVPFVTKPLENASDHAAPASKETIWALIEQDYNDAINSGSLPDRILPMDTLEMGRVSKQAAQAFLGKAQLFEGKYAEAAATLKKVIDTHYFDLIDNFGDVLRTVQDFGIENVFEFNSLNDPSNAYIQGNTILQIMLGWRSDHLSLYAYWFGGHDIYPMGWGFANPTADTYNAFVQMEGANGYRLTNSIKTYQQVNALCFWAPITINSGTYLYGHEGYFNWKWRFLGSEVIQNSWGFATTNNYRVMRYSEVLLNASEAALRSGDEPTARGYINEVRERAKLTDLGTVTLDDIKKEKRLELWCEGTRFQDLVRWGDAAAALATKGQKVPIFWGYNNDYSYKVEYPYTNTIYGFVEGKHNLLPFPELEKNANPDLEQNPNW
jgi:starch-binding outer membrane protein, SusD/RagB family